MRTTTRSATSGSTALIRSAIAVHGATRTSERRAARRTIAACRDTVARSPGSSAASSARVRKCRALASRVHRSPPGVTNPTLFSATRRLRRTAVASLAASQAGLSRRRRPITLTS